MTKLYYILIIFLTWQSCYPIARKRGYGRLQQIEKNIIEANNLNAPGLFKYIHICYLHEHNIDTTGRIDSLKLENWLKKPMSGVFKDEEIVTAVFENRTLIGLCTKSSEFKLTSNSNLEFFAGQLLNYSNDNNIEILYSICSNRPSNVYLHFFEKNNGLWCSLNTGKNNCMIAPLSEILHSQYDLFKTRLMAYF